MIKLEKKQVKIISVLIALVFVGSVVALALTQTGNLASAAPSGGNVGVVDYGQIVSSHPDAQSVNEQIRAAETEIGKDFEEKSAGMNDQEKADYYRQCAMRFQEKQKELTEPLEKSVEDAIKQVSDAKGLSVVIEKTAVVYGGNDITQDVINKLAKK